MPDPSTSYFPPTSSGPGWNDPPPQALFTSKAKVINKPAPPAPAALPDPITQPLFGAPAPMPPYQPSDMTMMQPAAYQPPQPQQPLYGGGGMHQHHQPQHHQHQHHQPQQQPMFGQKQVLNNFFI